MSELDARILTVPEVEAIARRVQREPRYRSDADCDQAFIDRRALLEHLVALEQAGEHALDVIVNAVMDIPEARRQVRERQDHDADAFPYSDRLDW